MRFSRVCPDHHTLLIGFRVERVGVGKEAKSRSMMTCELHEHDVTSIRVRDNKTGRVSEIFDLDIDLDERKHENGCACSYCERRAIANDEGRAIADMMRDGHSLEYARKVARRITAQRTRRVS